MKYRKKPVVIEAIKFLGKENHKAVCDFVGELLDFHITGGIVISTLEGEMIANQGDYIIKGVMGEFYPCKPEVFEKTYELVSETH